MGIFESARAVPTEWTDVQCIELVARASELAQYGNLAGALLAAHLLPLGNQFTKKGAAHIRAYVVAHPDEAAHVWRLRVQPDYW